MFLPYRCVRPDTKASQLTRIHAPRQQALGSPHGSCQRPGPLHTYPGAPRLCQLRRPARLRVKIPMPCCRPATPGRRESGTTARGGSAAEVAADSEGLLHDLAWAGGRSATMASRRRPRASFPEQLAVQRTPPRTHPACHRRSIHAARSRPLPPPTPRSCCHPAATKIKTHRRPWQSGSDLHLLVAEAVVAEAGFEPATSGLWLFGNA